MCLLESNVLFVEMKMKAKSEVSRKFFAADTINCCTINGCECELHQFLSNKFDMQLVDWF